MMINRLWILLCLLLACHTSIAQDTLAITGANLVAGFIENINAKADRLDQKLDKYTAWVLKKVKKQESNLRKKLEKKDSIKAATVLGNADGQYKRLEQRLQNTIRIQQYVPAFDTISTSIKFLQQNPQLASLTRESDKLRQTLSKVNRLGSRLEKAEEIKIFLKERKQYLKDQLQNLGFAKELKKLNKQAYYYSQQVNEYKSLLKDHKKVEQKMVALLSKTKLFQNFMRKNSMLASLFRMPGDPDDPVNMANLSGLQTRASVNALIQNQLAAGGPNAQQQFQQNLAQAQTQLSKLKNKMNQLGAGASDAEIPERFKPNPERVKSLLKRLEFSVNIQSQKASNFFPARSGLGLSVGYRLSPNKIIGIGLAYGAGIGRGWNHIRFTQEAIGFRSFADIKLKGSFWFTSGFEMNYHTSFSSIDELKDLSKWSRSGLAGVSKLVSLKTKFFKKTKISLLWDFLSARKLPRGTPIIFRIGYSLN